MRAHVGTAAVRLRTYFDNNLWRHSNDGPNWRRARGRCRSYDRTNINVYLSVHVAVMICWHLDIDR